MELQKAHKGVQKELEDMKTPGSEARKKLENEAIVAYKGSPSFMDFMSESFKNVIFLSSSDGYHVFSTMCI